MEELLQDNENEKRAAEQNSQKAPGIEEVKEICKTIEKHNGGGVTALDLRKLNFWTDFFIIATVTSNTHFQGLLRHIKEFADEQRITIQRKTQREESGGWNLVDMGTVVIHLMSAQSREFYELEELWSTAGKIYP
jgi:ribosome-associated protein